MKPLNCKSNEASATAAEADRISDLPCEIVHQIFSFLPIKCIARTCVLSRRWNHTWRTYPCLDFTDPSAFVSTNHISSYVQHVASVLEKHSDVKILRYRGPPSRSGLKRLMQEAIAHNVEELDLTFTDCTTKECRFKFPGCIANSLSLRNLRFSSWSDNIRLPPFDAMKNGFKSLASLSLSRVYLSDQPSVLNLFSDSCSFPSLTELDLHCLDLKCLRIHMPGLRDISVRGCSTMEELDISAENLKKLSVVGSFPSLCPASARVNIDAPMLERITWSPYDVAGECVIGRFDSLNEAVVGFSLLKVGYSDSQIRSASNILTAISQCQSLAVDENIIKKWQEDLRELPHFVEDVYDWESTGSFVTHLKYVKMLGLSKTGIGLVKFLLKHGESLRRLSISDLRTIDSDVRDKIRSRIVGFPRASSSVDIIF